MLTDVGDTNELTQQALTEDILSKATGQEVCTPLKRSDFEKVHNRFNTYIVKCITVYSSLHTLCSN